MEFSVTQGDIAAQSADALVNAAGTSLEMGAGVAGALRRAGGEELNDAAIAKGPVELGDVAVTEAFDLDAEYVIHAAAMPHEGDGQATEASIRDATRNALQAADDRGCRSLVLPALGCGVAGFPLTQGARLICEEIDAYQARNLEDVRFITYSEEEFQSVQVAAAEFHETEA